MGMEPMTSLILPCSSCGQRNRVPAARLGAGPRCGHCHQPLAIDHPIEVDEATLDGVVRHAALPVLVDFWAPWCGPCRMVAPVLAEVARRHRGDAVVLKVNTDEHPGAGQRHQVSGIPTLVLFQAGRERDRLVGAHPAPAIESLLRRATSAPRA